MKKILAIFGATGYQGGAIISHLLSLPTQTYHIRALTRNPSSRAAQKLSSAGVDVVRADLDDAASLATALHGAHAVFLVTDFFSCADPGARHEVLQAKRVLSVLAASSTLEHLVYSSLPSVRQASGGRYAAVAHFDGKAEVVDFLKATHTELWGKTTVLWVGTYMQFWEQFPALFAPRKTVGEEGRECWVQRLPFHPWTKLPLVDVRDVGRTVRCVLEQGERLKGGTTVNLIAGEAVSVEEQLRIWARCVGKESRFEHISDEESLRGIEKLGFPDFLEKDAWEMSLAFRDCEGRLLQQEGVLQASEILPTGEELTTWKDFVTRENWGFLQGFTD